MEAERSGRHDPGLCLRGNLSEWKVRRKGRQAHKGLGSANAEGEDYFASARLTRQQARDSALSLLKEASENDDVDAETASEAAKSIETLASYTLSEAQIENMVTAKGYEDCVVFMSEDGVSVVVSTGEEGLQTEDIARITDIVKQETGLSAESIKIMEVN